jgi:putative membrane protein
MHRLTVTATLILVLAAACRGGESSTATTEAADTAGTAATGTTVTSPAGEASAPPPATVTQGDRAFVEKAARTGMAEVQLATNVSNRAQTQEVRAFAQRMITDHNRSNEELTTLAARKGIDPPADVDPEKKALDADLAKLTGPALDRAYMEAMVKDHEAAAAEFESASRQLADPELKAWAAKNVPILHEHHHMAQEILGTMK